MIDLSYGLAYNKGDKPQMGKTNTREDRKPARLRDIASKYIQSLVKKMEEIKVHDETKTNDSKIK